MQTINNNDVSSSRSVNLTAIDEEKIVNDALDVLKRNTERFLKSVDNSQILNHPIKFLGLSVGKFETQDSKRSNTIQDMFKKTIDTQAKIDEKNDSDSSVIGKTMAESRSDDKRDISATKKCATIEEMFKRPAEPSVKGDEKREGLSIDDAGNGSNKSAEQTNVKQSFFAKLKITKPTVPTAEVEIHPSASTDVGAEKPCEENDDQNAFQNDVLLEEIAENEQVLSRMRAPSPVASTSKAADYTQTYAEFYRPPPSHELPKVKCSQCNKMISAHETQVHADEHFAFQLTQEQRIEFQNQLTTSTAAAPTPPAAKKMKTSKASTTTNNTFSIDKFLVKKLAAQPDEGAAGCSSAIVDVETELCTECGRNIPIADILEHTDFHAAKKLHEELLKSEMAVNRSAVSGAKSKTNATTVGKGNKSKKKTNNNNNSSTNKSNSNNSMKSIVTFFQNT